MEEVGSLLKPIALPERWVIPFGALLNTQHRSLEVVLRRAWRIYTCDKHITTLGEELPQFTAYRIGERLIPRRGCKSVIRRWSCWCSLLASPQSCHLDHKGQAGGKRDGKIRTAPLSTMLRFVHQT